MSTLQRVAARALRCLDPERAHAAAVALLQYAPLAMAPASDPALTVEAFGLRFANPVGLAAGFDKDARAVVGALGLGFGFTEVGTLTPRAQPGNPRPRVFRLSADQAVINRYGFNNEGHAAAHTRLSGLRARRGIVGVNVGANKDTVDRAADYEAGITRFADVADYFTLNISSPNTPGLRDLQAGQALDELLGRAIAARDGVAGRHGRRPLLLKIAPDLDDAMLDTIVATARTHGIDGMIVSNTTIGRPADLRDALALEAGGLSGRPLFEASTRVLARIYLRVEGQFPLIGVGGIDSPSTAIRKITAGATLIQLYTGLIYQGTGLVGAINRGLANHLAATGTTLAALTGSEAARFAGVDGRGRAG